MKGLYAALLRHGGGVLFGAYRRLCLDLVRLRLAVWYLRGVKAARSAFSAAVALALCLIVGGSGFVMLHIGLFLLLPAPWNAVFLLAAGAVYTIVVLLILRWVCSEKTWLKFSRADKLVARAAKKKG
jgi:hypothetical protein